MSVITYEVYCVTEDRTVAVVHTLEQASEYVGGEMAKDHQWLLMEHTQESETSPARSRLVDLG